MRHVTLAVALLICVAAGPATQPDSSAYPALQKKLAALNADNRQLRGQVDLLTQQLSQSESTVEALRKQAAAVADKDTAQAKGDAIVDEKHPDPAAFKRFGNRFFECIAKSHGEQVEGKPVEGTKPSRVNLPRLVSIDLKKTESVLSPFVGEIVWTEYTHLIKPGVVLSSTYRYSVKLSPAGGKWSIIEIIRKVDSNDITPKPETWRNRTGDTETVPAGWLNDELAAAQR